MVRSLIAVGRRNADMPLSKPERKCNQLLGFCNFSMTKNKTRVKV